MKGLIATPLIISLKSRTTNEKPFKFNFSQEFGLCWDKKLVDFIGSIDVKSQYMKHRMKTSRVQVFENEDHYLDVSETTAVGFSV